MAQTIPGVVRPPPSGPAPPPSGSAPTAIGGAIATFSHPLLGANTTAAGAPANTTAAGAPANTTAAGAPALPFQNYYSRPHK